MNIDERMRDIVRRVAELDACTFAFCHGPKSRPVNMRTCRACWLAYDARQVLIELATTPHDTCRNEH